MAFSWPNMCLKKWHFLDILCAVLNLNYALKKIAFSEPGNHHNWVKLKQNKLTKKGPCLDLVCLVCIETITTGLSQSNRSGLKKWHFQDLVCSAHIVTITTGVSHSNRIGLKKWYFPDILCSVHVFTITTGSSYRNRICFTQ